MVFEDCISRVRDVAQAALGGLDGAPLVTIGGSTVQRPREFLVRELPQSVDVSDPVTSKAMGARACAPMRVDFTVACQCWAKTKGLEEAAFLVAKWAQLFALGIGADRTLGGACVHAQPYFGDSGTAYDNGKALYVAAMDLGARVKADLRPAQGENSEG